MTMGEGGFVATDSNVKRMVLASYRDWGRACYCNTAKPGSVTSGTACGNRFQKWLPGMNTTTFDHRYVFDEIGYNLKPLDLAASIGLEQIKKLPMLDEARRKNFKRLKEIFTPYEDHFHLPEPTYKADPCWFGFLLTVRDGSPIRRQEFVDFMESKKIQTRSYFTGLVLAHPGYIHLAKDYGILERTFPVAAKVTHDSFFLGTYLGLTTEKLDYIEECVKEFFRG